MPLPNEVQQHIRATIAAKDDQLAREMNVERGEAAAELAAKGLSNSSVRVQRDIDAIERFIENRMTAHVEIYLDTLAELGIKIDTAIEEEIVQQLGNLKTAQNAAMPPGMAMMNVHSIREMYRSRLGSADTRAFSNAKNRLRMARLKDALAAPVPQPSVVSHTHHYTATGPNARVNVGSTDNSSNTIQAGAAPASPETTEKRGWTPSDQLAVALFCLSGLVAAVSIWMEKTPMCAAGTVCAMVLLVIYPVLHFIRLWKRKIPALVAVWALIALFGWKIWPRPVTTTPQPVVRNTGAILVPGQYPNNGNVDPRPEQISKVTPGKQERGGELGQSATVADGVRAMLREELQVDESKIKPQSDLILDLGATPLDVSEIVMELETSYDIKISSSEARKLKSVQDLIDCVEKKTAETSTPPKRLQRPIQ